MGRRIIDRVTLIDEAATTVHAGYRVTDFRNCVLSVIGSQNCNMKIFVKGAIGKGEAGDTRPDFTVLSSNRNNSNANWDFIEVVDLEDGAAIDGDDGINLSGNNVRNFEINLNAFDWLSVHATAVIAGTVTVIGAFTTNA